MGKALEHKAVPMLKTLEHKAIPTGDMAECLEAPELDETSAYCPGIDFLSEAETE